MSTIKSMTKHFILSCLLILETGLIFHTVAAPLEADRPVRIQSGLMTGVVGSDPLISVYKGIPFASPPIGELRWKVPQQPENWKGVKKANNFGKSCMQNLTRRYLPWTEEYMIGNDVSEDCLTLNVWSGAKSDHEKRPVMIYIHGGAYTGGSGEVALYNGEQLAKKGMVVVTVNYRLGIFGFFAHPELTQSSPHHSSGNYALLDNIAALKWVQKNIGAFGGDPNNVTIAGQSAGASSIHYLIASPLAKGLFHKAIAQSGAWSKQRKTLMLSSAEKKSIQYMKKWEVKSVKQLKSLSANELQALHIDFSNRFVPVVDGWVVPKTITEQHERQAHNDVPMLMGLTADEGSSSNHYQTSSEASKQAARDQGIKEAQQWAMFRSRYGHSVSYIYYMKRVTPWPEYPLYGAFHSSELPYVFNNQHLIDRPWQDIDQKLSNLMSDYWVNFMTNGDPNNTKLPHWSANKNFVMQFDELLISSN